MNTKMRTRIIQRLLLANACLVFVLNHAAWCQEDVADVPSTKHQLKDHPLEYHVIGGEAAEVPQNGYKLLVVLPGGDGSADFLPFVKRIYQNALGKEYLVIQLVAHPWTRNQKIVWPTKKNRVPQMKLSTEEFIASAVSDVAGRVKIDKQHVYTLGWSSGGPAVYAASLAKETPITGSFVAMSVFNPQFLPPLESAKGRAYYLWHSPEDPVCPFRMAQQAENQLRKNGGTVRLETYPGGHGWRGDVFGNLRDGVAWLEEQSHQASEK